MSNFVSAVLKFWLTISFVAHFSVHGGGGRRFSNNFGNHNNVRRFGGNFHGGRGRPNHNQYHNNNFNNERTQFGFNIEITCTRPFFTDASLEIENCSYPQASARHMACHDTNQGIPIGWKVKMVCQRGNRLLKYGAFCTEDGSWSPAFVENCDEVFDLHYGGSSRSDSTPVGQQGLNTDGATHGQEPPTTFGSNSNYNQHQHFQHLPNRPQQHTTTTHVREEDCKMLQIHLSNNFELTCLGPGDFYESSQRCVEANKQVPSGTKVFLRCKPPFTNPTSEDSEWTCTNGQWNGSKRKVVCVYEYTTEAPTSSPPPNYGWVHPDANRPSQYTPTESPIQPIDGTPPNYGWVNPSTTRPPPYVPPKTVVTPAPTTRLTTTSMTTTTTTPTPKTTRPVQKVMCPPLTQRSPGILIQCIIGGSEVYSTSCEKWNVIGTEASYSCRRYYESNLSLNVLYRTCKKDGTWTGSSDSFACVAQCGKANTILSPRITFGATTTRNQWPWHAAIYLQDRSEWKYVCGGTVLTSRSVITAAHCITLYQTKISRDPSEIRVELGKYRREERDEYVQIKRAESFEIYDSYDPFSFESDIGIIILEDEITFGYHVRPACFPQTSDSALEEQQLVIGATGTIVGFGYDENGQLSDELKMASLQVVSPSECSDVNEGGSLSSLNSRSTTYCAGLRNRTNVCNGDSGGGMVFPLKSEDTVRWYIQGIVSAGISTGGKCDPEKYSVFTRVGRYASWITRTLSHHDVF